MNRLNRIFALILVLCFMSTSVNMISYAEEATEASTVSAYGEISIVTCGAYEGGTLGVDPYGVPILSGTIDGAWARFDNIDFGMGEVKEFLFKYGVGSGYGGGVVTAYIDSMDSEPVATMTLVETGNFNTHIWLSVPVNNSEIVGVHTVYLTFTGRRSLGNISALKFSQHTDSGLDSNYPSDIIGTEYEEPFKILAALGIVDFEENRTYSVSRKATGEDILRIAARITNIPDDAESLKALASRLSISLDENVDYDAASKVATYILGYEEVAKLEEDYDAFCKLYAERNDVFDGVQVTNGAFTKGSLLQFAYNMLDKDVAALYSIGDSWVKKNIRPTVSSYYLSVYIDTGVVDGNMYTSLTGPTGAGEGEVLIDGVKYQDGGTNASDLLGRGVQFYYKEDDAQNRQLIYIKEYNNNIITVADEDVISYRDMSLEYYDKNEKVKKLPVSNSVDFIYNHSVLLSYDESIFDNFNGTVTMIDNNDDGRYEIIEMLDTYDIVVETLSNDIIYEKNGKRTINLNGPILIIKDQYGNLVDESELQKLSSGNVLTVAETTNLEGDKIYDIVIARKNVTGVVSSVNDNEFVEVNGKTYKLSKNVKYSTDDTVVTAGSRVMLYLNAAGEVVLVHFAASTEVYGYITGVAQEFGFDPIVKVKIFNRDGVMAEYECNNPVKIDDKSYKSGDEIYNLIKTHNGSGSLVIYSLNDKGKIISIDFPYDNTGSTPSGKETWEKENSLHMTYSTSTNVTYSNNAKSFSGFAPYSNNAIVFCIPPSGTEKYYIVQAAGSTFVASTGYKIKAYATDVAKLTSDVYVLDQFADDSEFLKVINAIGETSNDNVCYVCELSTVWDETAEEAITKITYYTAGALKTVLIDNSVLASVPDIGVGDSVRLKVDQNGYALNIVKMFDFDTNTIDRTNTSESYTGTRSCRMGTVEVKNDTYFKLAEYDEIYNAATANIYVYEETRNGYPISVGTTEDILDANKISGGSRIVLNAYAGKPLSILIIR